MIKIKVDGEVYEFRDWLSVHDEFTDSRAHCYCIGFTEAANHDYVCESIVECIKNTLDQGHTWEEVA